MTVFKSSICLFWCAILLTISTVTVLAHEQKNGDVILPTETGNDTIVETAKEALIKRNNAEEKYAALANPCPEGSCTRAGSDSDDNSGFIKGKNGLWAVFLFALIGILVTVAILVLLLRFVCSKSESSTSPTDQISNGPSGNIFSKLNKPQNEKEQPQQFPQTSYDQFDQQQQNFNKDDAIFRRFEKESLYQSPNQDFYRQQPVPSEALPSVSISNKEFLEANQGVPVAGSSISGNYVYDVNEPYKYLDKYNPDSPVQGGSTTGENAMPRATLWDNTPYKIVEQNAGYVQLNEFGHPLENGGHERASGRFVRVLPSEPASADALRPSPPPVPVRRY